MNTKLNDLKGYEVGCRNSKKGKMIVNFNGRNFLVTVEPIRIIGEPTLENVMEEYDFMFRD